MTDLKRILDDHVLWLFNDENGVKANLQDAHLRGANLQWANLRWANLQDADLQDANLRGAVGNLREVKSIEIFEYWEVTYTRTHMAIGCQQHKIADWWAFDDKTIRDMDLNALDWWRKNKDTLRLLIERNPAE